MRGVRALVALSWPLRMPSADRRGGLERDDWLALIMVRLPFRSAYAAVS